MFSVYCICICDELVRAKVAVCVICTHEGEGHSVCVCVCVCVGATVPAKAGRESISAEAAPARISSSVSTLEPLRQMLIIYLKRWFLLLQQSVTQLGGLMLL